jgi:arylsulfate sulfotransferase
MTYSKTFFTIIIVVLAAFCAGPASSQVRCKVPAPTVTMQPTSSADTGDSMMATSFFSTQKAKGCAAITNLQGVPSWSYCIAGNLMMTRAVPGGTFLLITNQNGNQNTGAYTVSEINLAGTTLNSLTEVEANTQLKALGAQSIIDYNHEAMRLPNGDTAVIAHVERLYTNEQGGTPQNPVDILGDQILVLDTSWNIVWTWNAYDWLPVSRAAVLGETCKPCVNIDTGGCCPVKLAPVANDWLHGNSLAYDSTDGNLIMSLRSQDWIVKINYANGTGDGSLVWTLGYEADLTGSPYFKMLDTPKVPSPWFSHQHDVEVWVNENPKQLTLFDNGNTRHATNPNADSRGQALIINETAFTVDIHTNVDFPFYSGGYGTSQILDNGNYWWQAGGVGGKTSPDPTESSEYVPSGYTGIEVYGINFADTAYRSFRLDAASGF